MCFQAQKLPKSAVLGEHELGRDLRGLEKTPAQNGETTGSSHQSTKYIRILPLPLTSTASLSTKRNLSATRW